MHKFETSDAFSLLYRYISRRVNVARLVVPVKYQMNSTDFCLRRIWKLEKKVLLKVLWKKETPMHEWEWNSANVGKKFDPLPSMPIKCETRVQSVAAMKKTRKEGTITE